MDSLQTLLDGTTLPVVTAFVLGLLTAVSPCPLATNIAAIGYLARDLENRRTVLRNGMLYTFGRTLASTLLGAVLIALLRGGASLFAVERAFGRWGEIALGPLLAGVGLFLLFGDRLRLPGFGPTRSGERIGRRGGWGALLLGMLFALAFCPTSGLFFFGVLIPLSAAESGGYLLPAVYAVASALPVAVAAWLLASGTARIGAFYNRMRSLQRWMNRIVGGIFLAAGIYYGMIYLF